MRLAVIAICLAAGILIAHPSARCADIYTGGEWDSDDQGFYFVGASGVLGNGTGTALAGRVFAGHLTYRFEGDGRLLTATVPMANLSAGIRYGGEGYSATGYVGVDLRRTERESATGAETAESETGLSFQAELFAWGEDHGNVSLIASYGTIDDFFWSRVRAKWPVYRFSGSWALMAGAEAVGMGNSDFSAAQAGIVAEMADTASTLSILFKGGLKDSSALGGGVYGGVEIYRAF